MKDLAEARLQALQRRPASTDMTRIAAATLALVALLLAPAAAQNGNSAWLSWARANHHPVSTVNRSTATHSRISSSSRPSSVNGGSFSSARAATAWREFNHAKVRLIKFLHQQMGFDVIAFESGLFECFNADATWPTRRRCC